MNDSVKTKKSETKDKKRVGGFAHASWGFLVGAAVGAWLALSSVSIVASFTEMTEQQLREVNSLPARIAVVVAGAALIAFIGVMLDVVHTSTNRWYDFAVRQFALVAGTAAFIGSWIALPASLNAAMTFWVTTILTFVVIAVLMAGVWLRSRAKA